MSIKTLFTLSFLFFLKTISAQTTKEARYHSNMLYLEFFGNGIVASVNYEHMFHQDGVDCFSMRAGLGIVDDHRQTIPLEAIWLTGGVKHHIDVGPGLTFLFDQYTPGKTYFIPVVHIGYRYQAPESNFLFRAGLSALFTDHYNNESTPKLNPGIAIGLAL
jgi:hypothetical protein